MKIATVLLLFAVAVPAPEIRHFRFLRPIDPLGKDGQACVAIDPGVFAHAAPQLTDLRLYKGTTETPYELQIANPPVVPEQQIAPVNLGRDGLGRDGGATVFDAAMPPGNHSDVELSVNPHDFIAAVTVSGSQQQGPGARTQLGKFTIFDLSRQRLGRSTVLHLPPWDFRFLHFRIDGPIAPQDVGGIAVSQARSAEPKYEVVAESARVTRNGHASVIEFDVPAHTPVDRIVFVPGPQPANFSRDVTVSFRPVKSPSPGSEDSTETSRQISAGNLVRIHRVENGSRIDEERLSLDAPMAAPDEPTKWTVSVENGDDPPVEWRTARLEMVQRNVCFEAAAGAAYTLYYGDPALAAPQYDYARLFTPQPGAAGSQFGPESTNPGFQPRPDERPFTERHPALLWIALGAVVLLLGGIALRSAKLTAKPD
jgi:Protein of unknown function (DUF3999)